MGTLKPGATYIYEKADGVTYAREFGKSERFIIGYDETFLKKQKELMWRDILKEAETNESLQQAIEKVIMLYRLSKDNPL